jgi:hypothetical protein
VSRIPQPRGAMECGASSSRNFYPSPHPGKGDSQDEISSAVSDQSMELDLMSGIFIPQLSAICLPLQAGSAVELLVTDQCVQDTCLYEKDPCGLAKQEE